MSFNSGAVASALVTVLEGLTGMGAVQIGAPTSVGPTVSAYVTMGSINAVRVVTGVTRRQSRFFICLCYRIDGAESTAETTLMSLVDELMADLHADLTLGGVVDDLEISSNAADDPDYQLRAGKEYREYPLIVTVAQDGVYTVNP